MAGPFRASVPGKPLSETVWDNSIGPFWDVKESNRIGFTQNYREPILVPTGYSLTINTRIFRPFGRSFTSMLESALKKSYSKSFACFDSQCLDKLIAEEKPGRVLKVKVASFHVWEHPMNHLNLYAKGSCRLSGDDGRLLKQFEFEKKTLNHKLGSILSTHSSFINAMNSLLYAFSEDMSKSIALKIAD